MSGDWIKMRIDLPDDPAVYQIAAITRLDRFGVIGRLYAFWAWADKYAVDGHVDGATSTIVDDICRHDGFADALVSVKWLEVGERHITLPHHERHNGESAKERSLKNSRQAKWRQGKAKNLKKTVDATPSTQADATSSTDVDATPSTTPSTREEKRREDISTTVVVDKRARKSSDDFVFGDWHIDFARHNNLDLNYEWEKCVDHFKSNGEVKKNWDATFRNWLRRAIEYRKNTAPKQTYFDKLQNVSDQLTGRTSNAGITIDMDQRALRKI